MKAICSFVTAVVFALHSAVCAADSVQVVSLKGSVTGRAPGAAEAALKPGDAIGPGWTVTTGRDSNVVLRFDDGQIVALQSQTAFRIDAYHYDQVNPSTGRVWLSLLKGGLRAITGLVVNTNRSAFTLTTRTATIGIRGTDLMTVDFQNVYTQVVDGTISVSTTEGTELATIGQTVVATSTTAKPLIVHPTGYPEGLFLELRSIQLPAAIARAPAARPVTTAGGAAPGAGPPAGGLSGLTATGLLVGSVAALGLALAWGAGGAQTTTATHH
jgi:hypothetical protein